MSQLKRAGHLSWDELESMFRAEVERSLREWIAPATPHYQMQLEFALGRLDEGRNLADHFRSRIQTGARILDLGAGNGGVALGMGFRGDFEIATLDLIPNKVFRKVRSSSGVPVKQIIGSGHEIPFADASLDVVVCLEVLEHIAHPQKLGAEIMRVLKPGGICHLQTPARVKWLFRRDPHFGIPGLLLLPDSLQRYVVADILKRTTEYDVQHTFWTLRGIGELFPRAGSVEPLFNASYPIAGRGRIYNRFWWRFRELLWDRVVVQK